MSNDNIYSSLKATISISAERLNYLEFLEKNQKQIIEYSVKKKFEKKENIKKEITKKPTKNIEENA